MFAYNTQVTNCGNSNPVEFLNGYTEEQISFWESNQAENTTNNDVEKNTNGIDDWTQQQWQESSHYEAITNNMYQLVPNKPVEVVGRSAACSQWSSYNYQCTNNLTQIYCSAQWPNVKNNSSTLQPNQRNLNKYYKICHRGNNTNGQTSFGNFRAIMKRKRKRTIFTTEQVEALEKIFSKKPYISRDDRQYIVNQLNLSDKSVKIWFQNRRLKDKRHDNEINDDVLEETDTIDIDSLDYVESEIRKNTDEFGYVTLDDRIMGDLVNIIDNCLTRNNDIEVCSSSDTVENGNSIIYEPISPASSECSGMQTNMSDWESIEPTQSLQTLLDIQSLIKV